ncbi:sigma factor-like helix-turn-helix DNA-binding protein [Sphingomonas sp.]|uniref:sigma factor-like helix-turn-helix DNA-binding protein n=1 Tax=Sphingomonas sp. TaxID=28214 RepID=UPI003CC5A247
MDNQEGALGRLTGNEKECLRRRLLHQTAKEMALELGISPHAVEKRLKMARLKLGVGSSLAAARLLAEAEGYGRTLPQPPDLPGEAPLEQGGPAPIARRGRRVSSALVSGAMPMILAALLITLSRSASTPQPSPSPAPSAPASTAVPASRDMIVDLPVSAPGPHLPGVPAPVSVDTVRMRAAGPEEVTAFVRSSFHTMDKDGSGFIDQREAPAMGIGVGEPHARGAAPHPSDRVRWFTGPQGQAMWIANMDIDRDGRVSETEYVVWDSKFWRDHVPANWAWRR